MLAFGVKITKCSSNTEGEDGNAMIISKGYPLSVSLEEYENIGTVKRKGNESPHALEGNETERHSMNR